MAKRNVLIIEGGGAEGLYAAGVVSYLIKIRNMTFDAMFGTSIGGTICLCLASHYTKSNEQNGRRWIDSAEKMEADMASLSKWDLVKSATFFGFFKGGYLKSNVKNVVNKLFANDLCICDLHIPVQVFATDIDAITPVKIIQDGYRVDDACAITSNVPGAFCAYEDPFDKHRLFDGGIACNSPVSNAVKYARNRSVLDTDWEDTDFTIIRMGAYEPIKKNGFLTATENLMHCFWIARYTCEQLSMKLGYALVGNDKRFRTIAIPYSLGLFEFNPKTNMANIQKGYEYAQRHYSNNTNG